MSSKTHPAKIRKDIAITNIIAVFVFRCLWLAKFFMIKDFKTWSRGLHRRKRFTKSLYTGARTKRDKKERPRIIRIKTKFRIVKNSVKF